MTQPISLEENLQKKSATKALFVVSLLALLALALAVPGLAQDQINLTDGLHELHWNGIGSTHVSLLIPSHYCSGGTCTLAQAAASGTGNLASSGTYTVTSAATTPVTGGWDGPLYLTMQSDGSSIVTQTEPIQFDYTSGAGTLTGLLNFTTMSATDSHLQSVMQGTLVVTGGTFAPYFPYGGTVNITWGLTFPLQILWQLHGFATSEFNSGTIDPAQACGALSRDRKNRSGEVEQLAGLPRMAGINPDDLIGSFTQTNNQQIPCSASTPCGSMDVALGTGGFAGDLVVTVQLSGVGQPFQFDRIGFNSDVTSGLFLDCFNFGASCTSGVGGASLQGAKQEDGFGRFQNTLYTGLHGGSGCSPDGTGCQNLFTFVIGDSNGPLQLSDFNAFVAGHVANGACSGYIATPTD